jgi:hypothetical protein
MTVAGLPNAKTMATIDDALERAYEPRDASAQAGADIDGLGKMVDSADVATLESELNLLHARWLELLAECTAAVSRCIDVLAQAGQGRLAPFTAPRTAELSSPVAADSEPSEQGND